MNDRLNFEAESFAVQPEFEGEFQEFAAEQTEAEWAGESGRMRRLPSRAGQPAPRFSRPTGRFSGRPSRTRPVQPSRPTLWRPRPRSPYVWPPRVVVRDPYSIVREPYSVESPATVISSSEYIRWVQDCLNRILGLWLPLTGVLGRETRSAVRSFQKQQGLPVNGVVGPGTRDALQAACERWRPVDTRAADSEFSEELPYLRSVEDENNGFSKRELLERFVGSKEARGSESAEILEPIRRAIQVINPTQHMDPQAQPIPWNRLDAINAIDAALTGLSKIPPRGRTQLDKVSFKRHLIAILEHLDAAGGSLQALGGSQSLTQSQINEGRQAASASLTAALTIAKALRLA